MSELSTRLKSARLPERTVVICLRGDLVAELEELERAYTEAVNRPATSLADGGEAAEIATKVEAMRAEMSGEMLTIRLRALPRRRYNEMIAEHPPRLGDDGNVVDEDSTFGYDASTFFEALVRAAIIEPELDAGDWDALDAILTDNAFQQLANVAVMLNRRGVDVPFSLAASHNQRTSGAE